MAGPFGSELTGGVPIALLTLDAALSGKRDVFVCVSKSLARYVRRRPGRVVVNTFSKSWLGCRRRSSVLALTLIRPHIRQHTPDFLPAYLAAHPPNSSEYLGLPKTERNVLHHHVQ